MTRDEAVAALQEWLNAATASGDDAAMLDPIGPDLAAHVAQVAADADIEAWTLIGAAHWLRYQALPEGEDEQDLAACVAAYDHVYPHAPQLVPLPLHQLLEDERAVEYADRAVRLLQDPRTAGNLDALSQAIDLLRQAVALTPADHPELGGYLSNLGNALLARFERTGAQADLDEAITVGRQAVTLTPTDHPNLGVYLSNLGNALLARFDRTGAQADLDEAITVGRQAVTLTPADNPNLGGYLYNLGIALKARFGRGGAQADLDEAITAGRQAVTLTPTNHPNVSMYLSNLGNALLARFDRTGAQADLDEALTMVRQAVTLTPTNHPNLDRYLSNLGAALQTRFGRTGAQADLDEAITMGRQAVTPPPPTTPNSAGACPTSAPRCGPGSIAPAPRPTSTRRSRWSGRR